MATNTKDLIARALLSVAVLSLPLDALAQENTAGDRDRPVQLAATAAQEQDIVTAPSPTQEDSTIGAVVIVGNEALPDSHYQTAIENYFGERGSEDTLARLTAEIERLAQDEGYTYARASILPSAAAQGIYQIAIDEGRIDEVTFDGYQNARAIALAKTFEGRVAHRPALEQLLLHMADIPAVRLRSATFNRVDGRGVLAIGLAKNEGNYSVETDNYGTQSFGPWRVRASLRHTDVLTASDALTAAVRINPIEPGELLFFSAGYEAQVTARGPVLGISGSIGNTAPGGIFEGTDLTGDSRRVSLSLTQPLIRTRTASLWAELDATYLRIEQDVLDTILRSDTVVTASFGLRGEVNFDDVRLRAGLRHVRGLDILGATRLGTPLASRADGDAVFSKLEGWFDAQIDLAPRLSTYFLARGQIADRPLLSSQELSLGGAYTVRGYNFSEALGDEGLFGLAELRYNLPAGAIPLDALQLYGFLDGGYISEIGNDIGEGSLFSAGPGLRTRFGPLNLELETAFPLGGSAERTPDNDPQVNVRAGVNF